MENEELPKEYIIPNLPPVFDQGGEGSSAACAAAYALSIQWADKAVKENLFSPEFLYNNIKMDKIPTAEELLNGILGKDQYPTDTSYAMIEFAKMHVKAALEAAGIYGKAKEDTFTSEDIINAYPLTNIK